uniref:Uncharacterized protein n=1 Tax=Pithovirus LCPAC401 TaxID=2506595 RepID=A0A481Z9I3_9VIRU|nr:MAG: uncharacterized protein LCPAC401_02010 [Pithovirus LCPAC401]
MFVICNNDKNNPGINMKDLKPELVIFLDKRNSDLIWRMNKCDISPQPLYKVNSYMVCEDFLYNEIKGYCVNIIPKVGWRSHPDIIAYVLENVQYTYQLVEVEAGKKITEFQINGYSLIIISDNHIQSF